MPAKSVHAFSAMLRQGATDGIEASHLRLKPRVGAWHFDMIWAPINAKPFRHRTAIQKVHCPSLPRSLDAVRPLPQDWKCTDLTMSM